VASGGGVLVMERSDGGRRRSGKDPTAPVSGGEG
jgi:hypothetical protein